MATMPTITIEIIITDRRETDLGTETNHSPTAEPVSEGDSDESTQRSTHDPSDESES